MSKGTIFIKDKPFLSVKEASTFTGTGEHKLREIAKKAGYDSQWKHMKKGGWIRAENERKVGCIIYRIAVCCMPITMPISQKARKDLQRYVT